MDTKHQINASFATNQCCTSKLSLGPVGYQFGGNFLRSASGNVVTLQLNGLPTHTAISVSFLFAAIDSLDGTGTFPQGDFLHATLDGFRQRKVARTCRNPSLAPVVGALCTAPLLGSVATVAWASARFSSKAAGALPCQSGLNWASLATSGETRKLAEEKRTRRPFFRETFPLL